MGKASRKFLGAVFLALVVVSAAVAGQLEDMAAASVAYGSGDYSTALRLLRPLADQGNTEGQFLLGFMYEYGNGVPQNDGEAVKWYRLAADQGDADAQFRLGFMYGLGPEAVKWYRRAAVQGHAAAQLLLGLAYADGVGVPKDVIEGLMWLGLAASNPVSGQDNRDEAASNRDSVASEMTPAQIAEAQKLAREWKPTAGR